MGWCRLGLASGAIATGLTYGATKHGVQHLDTLNIKARDSLNRRFEERNALRELNGKSHVDPDVMQSKMDARVRRAGNVSAGLGHVGKSGNYMFGEGKWGSKRAAISAGVGLVGGALAGSGINYLNN